MNQLGALIGVVEHSFKITNSRDESTSLKLRYDFTNATDNQIKSWLASNRTIAWQRANRTLSLNELNGVDGSTVVASNASKKAKSRDQQIADLVNAGIPEQLAVIAVDNPGALEQITASVENGENNA
jgi:hypothetical protein